MPPAPSAQKMMAENNLSADQVAGSGKRGQVLKEDVIGAIASGATAASSAPAAAQVARGPVAAEDEVREERVRMRAQSAIVWGPRGFLQRVLTRFGAKKTAAEAAVD